MTSLVGGMRKLDLVHLTNAELANRFAEAAKKRGRAIREGEVRDANRMYHYMDAIHSILRSRGLTARQELLPLLDGEDRYVQYYTAIQLLGVVPDRAREIIESNHKYWSDAIAFDAGMILYNLDIGVFRPD